MLPMKRDFVPSAWFCYDYRCFSTDANLIFVKVDSSFDDDLKSVFLTDDCTCLFRGARMPPTCTTIIDTAEILHGSTGAQLV